MFASPAVAAALLVLPWSVAQAPADDAPPPPVVAPSAPVAAAASSSSSSPTIAVAFQPTIGLSDDETAGAERKIADEVGALGITVAHADAVDPGCVPDVACVDAARTAQGSGALLVVELARVGPVVQLTATGAAGDARATGAHGLSDAQLASGPFLPPGVRLWVQGIATPKPAQTKPAQSTPAPATTTPTAAGSLSMQQSGALFAAGLGGLALVVGVVLLATSEATLETDTAKAAQKEQAVTSGWIGVGAAGVGVLALGGAAALFVIE